MAKANFDQWEGFGGHLWKEEVNVRDFIQHNYTQYDGDESFLAGPTEDERSGAGCGPPDRQAAEACVHALRRDQDGGTGVYDLWVYSE